MESVCDWPSPLFVGVALLIGSSLYLYGLRGIQPFKYGCIEIAVGVVVLIFIFATTTHYLPFDVQTPHRRVRN
jgi:hypothetical protein